MNKTDNKRKFNKSDIEIIKWIYNIGKSQRWKVLTIVLADFVAAILTIVFADYSKKIINAATEDKDFDKVLFYGGCFLVCVVLQILLNLIDKSMTVRCKGRLDMILKQHILDTLMKKDYSSVIKYHTGELQNRMFNDVNVITENFTNLLPSVVFFVVKLVCAFGYLIFIDKIFALIFLIGGIFVFLGMQLFRGVLKRLHKDVQATEGKTRSFIQESLENLLVIKSFMVSKKISETTNELQEQNYSAIMKRRGLSIAANGTLSFVFNLGYVFALMFGGYRLIMGMDYGTITAMLQLVGQIQSPFAQLSSVMPKYFEFLASAERIMELETLPDEISSNEEYIDIQSTYENMNSIEFENISFKYDRDIILNETSLSVNKGEFVAIMGISGIGKSTLLKLLLGVFKVDSGSIYINENKENITVDYHTRKLFSYVPQGNMILSGTIRENLTFINDDVTDDEINQAIWISCCDEFINDLPDGLETLIGERGIGLSEGQLQRIAIARSLLSKSPVLLLDEATSALDEETEKRFLTNLRSLKNKTCIIVSHKKAALEICDKCIRIVDAKIIVD